MAKLGFCEINTYSSVCYTENASTSRSPGNAEFLHSWLVFNTSVCFLYLSGIYALYDNDEKIGVAKA